MSAVHSCAHHPAATHSQKHGPFHVGEQVSVKHYGDATVNPCYHVGYSGRLEVRYPDGSTYHCYPSRLTHKTSDVLPQKKAPFYIGEQVMVKDYGLATVVGLPVDGQYAGCVKVHTDGKPFYHCAVENVTTWDKPGRKRHHEFRLGEIVRVRNWGEATVIDLPTQGPYVGKVRVRYGDMTTYHCWPHELTPYSSAFR
eukprot:TRINITY_DN29775_c0_g1_i1.p1 TRINITY_DN29775_c0_g1~~TRINITY_DN29775_c0_g1_i1.p1  ORF type:complete len:197 (+),score=17.06 TRINITY_DN29775_c0_g1_i1:46-636(+)